MATTITTTDSPGDSEPIVTYISTVSRIVGTLVLLSLLYLLAIHRAYYSTLQRLYLILTFITTLNILVAIGLAFVLPSPNPICLKLPSALTAIVLSPRMLELVIGLAG